MEKVSLSVSDLNLPEGVDAGDVSDGYHTFNELYAHRINLFLLLMMSNKDMSFKTYKNKEGEEWKGWFIGGMDTEWGQITYHIPAEYYETLKGIKSKETNHNYDGHDAKMVQHRLTQMLRNL